MACSAVRKALLAGFLTLAATACSDGSSERATPPTSTAETTVGQVTSTTSDERARLTEAVRAYSAAYLGGRPAESHALLTARCQARVTLPAMTVAVNEAKRLYGNARITSLNIETLSGPLARVTYRYDVSAIDQQSEPWANEGGQWRQDDC